MMWLYDLSLGWQFVLIVAVFDLVGVAGAVAFRRSMHRSVSQVHLHNDLVGFFLATLGVFYGLLTGLVAVAAWEMHEDAETLVAREATAVAALYRDVSVYPEPDRSQLQGLLKEYIRFVIEEAWPMQRLVHHPSLMNAGEGCRAAASRRDAKAGLILSANELRLGKPYRVSELRLLNPGRLLNGARTPQKQPTRRFRSLAETPPPSASRAGLWPHLTGLLQQLNSQCPGILGSRC